MGFNLNRFDQEFLDNNAGSDNDLRVFINAKNITGLISITEDNKEGVFVFDDSLERMIWNAEGDYKISRAYHDCLHVTQKHQNQTFKVKSAIEIPKGPYLLDLVLADLSGLGVSVGRMFRLPSLQYLRLQNSGITKLPVFVPGKLLYLDVTDNSNLGIGEEHLRVLKENMKLYH
jgi:hypothetical protein